MENFTLLPKKGAVEPFLGASPLESLYFQSQPTQVTEPRQDRGFRALVPRIRRILHWFKGLGEMMAFEINGESTAADVAEPSERSLEGSGAVRSGKARRAGTSEPPSDMGAQHD